MVGQSPKVMYMYMYVHISINIYMQGQRQGVFLGGGGAKCLATAAPALK